jgi:hypothetical protein
MKDTRHMGTCRAQWVEWRQWEVRAAVPWGADIWRQGEA